MSKETKQTNLEAAEDLLKAATAAKNESENYDALGERFSDKGDESQSYHMSCLASGERDAERFYLQQAQAYALIAISEQLRVANLIALGEAHRTGHVKRTQLDESLGHVEEVDVPKRVLLPDIAAILGLGDDHE